jgi:molybdopterin-guanine dinucleotide biosynthesis protein A
MLLRALASADKTTAVRAGGRAHPLIAFYANDDLDDLTLAIANGDAATAALEALCPDWIEATERETFNVNTPDDLARAEDLVKRPRS